MDNYDDYTERFIAALYLEAEKSISRIPSARDIHEKYGFKPKNDNWISRMADEWEYSYFKSVYKVLSGYEEWSFQLGPDGYRHVEANFRDADEIREYLGLGTAEREKPASVEILDSASAEIVPAANRLVRLNHNQSEYQEVVKGLDELFEQVRQNNQIGETAEERDRIIQSLTAARQLWSAAELYVVQIRVGVVMAIEDATSVAAKVGKAVGGALIVDLIKRIVKQATGIEF